MFLDALALSLIHFVWQGTAIAGAYLLFSKALAGGSASARYVIACMAMLAMAAAPVLTLFLLMNFDGQSGLHASASSLNSIGSVEGPLLVVPAVEPMANGFLPAMPADWAMWLVAVWFLGVAFFSVRLATGWLSIQRLRWQGARPAPEWLRRRLEELAPALGICHPVWLLESARAAQPMLAGWLRPTILLPLSLATKLPPAQLEALLLHELAHLRRHDYLVNILQSAVETALFYHPAVWWLGARIRAEREICCDDLVLRSGSDRDSYARALLSVAEMGLAAPVFAPAAGGGSLSSRVRRLLGMPGPETAAASFPPLAVAALAGFFTFAVASGAKAYLEGERVPREAMAMEFPSEIRLSVEAKAEPLGKILERLAAEHLPGGGVSIPSDVAQVPHTLEDMGSPSLSEFLDHVSIINECTWEWQDGSIVFQKWDRGKLFPRGAAARVVTEESLVRWRLLLEAKRQTITLPPGSRTVEEGLRQIFELIDHPAPKIPERYAQQVVDLEAGFHGIATNAIAAVILPAGLDMAIRDSGELVLVPFD